MKKKPKPDSAKLAEFFAETDKPSKLPDPSPGSSPRESEPAPMPYQCPNCRKPLRSRKEPCPHCGYHGYVPMSSGETGRIRWILFAVLLAIALAVYFLF